MNQQFINRAISTSQLTHLAFVSVKDEKTYFVKCGTGKLEDSIFTFYDLVENITIDFDINDGMQEIHTGHGVMLSDEEMKNITKYAAENKEIIKKSNEYMIDHVAKKVELLSYLKKCEETIQHVKDMDCDHELVIDYIELSKNLEIDPPLHDKNELNQQDIEFIRAQWRKIIQTKYEEAIETLQQERVLAETEDDEEAMDEIDMVKQLVTEDVEQTDLNQFDSCIEVIKYWPQLLLPAPEYTKYFT